MRRRHQTIFRLLPVFNDHGQRRIVGMDPAHRWQLPLEEVAQSGAAGATFAEQHGLLGFGVDHFNRVAATVVAAFAHNQAPSWFDGDRGGVMTLRPFGTLAVLSIVASDNAECLARVEVVIRPVSGCAPLPHRLGSLTAFVAAFQRRAGLGRVWYQG